MKLFNWLLGVSFCFLNSYGEKMSYVPGTEDIPLMEGTSHITEEPNVFDASQGRVSISKVISSSQIREIESFYENSLVNLGWKGLSKNKYQRGNQLLDIKIDPMGEKTLMTFELKESR